MTSYTRNNLRLRDKAIIEIGTLRVKILRGKTLIDMDHHAVAQYVDPYKGVVLDIGTGDGKFVYKSAQTDPQRLYIGIDSTLANLTEYAGKILKKPARGGRDNVLYVIANVTQLPIELWGIAERIFINFPWGSLLNGLVLGDKQILDNIARVAAPYAELEIFINYAVFSDPVPLNIASLPELTSDYIDTTLAPRYAQSHIMLYEHSFLGSESMKTIPTTWSRRLAFGKKPQTIAMRAIIQAHNHTTSILPI